MTKQEKEILKNEVLKNYNNKCSICNKKARDILPKFKSMNGSKDSKDYFAVCRDCRRKRIATIV